ncbi:SRPBCC family protein [Bradyrhizobium sp. SYSU BS000235]|uniref:SRPBCC family protein n=1 Tax=Bradyrhizobium sp. SYSU BS000235 TaxID=3411332 RepID=UPI003C72CE56
MLRKILFGLATLLVVLVVIIITQPSEYRVSRTLTMSAPAPDIFAQLNDFHRWEAWSPWAKLDPAAKVSFEGASTGKGAVFAWSGNSKVGEGRMTLVESEPDHLVRTRTDFVKPFVGSSYSEFTLRPEGSGTVVSWTMFGQNDFIGKAMCLVISMDKMLGGEMEKGLASVKGLVEAK